MKIGLVGEAPNDTTAIQNLLSRKYREFDFVTLLNRITGSMLDNKKSFRRLLRLEYEAQTPDIIIFIRDLDSLENDRAAKRKRQEIFSYSKRIVDGRGIHLLSIFELETLILSDIEAFNNRYGCTLAEFNDPMLIPMPKEVLIEASGYKFIESHNPELFSLLNFDIIMGKCRCFSGFIKKLEKAIAASS
jgi:hypothetical protein